MGGNKESSKSSRSGGSSNKDKGKAKEKSLPIQSSKSKGKYNQTIPEEDLSSSLPPLSSFDYSNSKFEASQETDVRFTRQPPFTQQTSAYALSQSAPAQNIAFAPYKYADLNITQPISTTYSLPIASQTEHTYQPSNLAADLRGLSLSTRADWSSSYEEADSGLNQGLVPPGYTTTSGGSGGSSRKDKGKAKENSLPIQFSKSKGKYNQTIPEEDLSKQPTSTTYASPIARQTEYSYQSLNLETDFGKSGPSSPASWPMQYEEADNSLNRYVGTSSTYTTTPGNSSTNFQGSYGNGDFKDTRQYSRGTNTNKELQQSYIGKRRNEKPLAAAGLTVHPSKEFTTGRVFKIYWVEPKGKGGGGQFSRGGTDLRASTGTFGKLRRFVIVENRRGHCTGIPIHTYDYKACTKPGCHPEDHAMVYTARWNSRRQWNRDPPPYVDGERGIIHRPVEIAVVAKESLADESRINYAKKYTIEHNWPVAFIGQIHQESEHDFWEGYFAVNDEINQLPDTSRARQKQQAGKKGSYSRSAGQQPPRRFEPLGQDETAYEQDESSLVSEQPAQPTQDRNLAPTNIQPSSSRRNKQGQDDRKERRDHKGHHRR